MIALHSLNAVRLNPIKISIQNDVHDLAASVFIKAMAKEYLFAIAAHAVYLQKMTFHD